MSEAAIEKLYQENKKMREALEWVKQRYEEEWTYEMGVGEVVCEIINKFEEEEK